MVKTVPGITKEGRNCELVFGIDRGWNDQEVGALGFLISWVSLGNSFTRKVGLC